MPAQGQTVYQGPGIAKIGTQIYGTQVAKRHSKFTLYHRLHHTGADDQFSLCGHGRADSRMDEWGGIDHAAKSERCVRDRSLPPGTVSPGQCRNYVLGNSWRFHVDHDTAGQWAPPSRPQPRHKLTNQNTITKWIIINLSLAALIQVTKSSGRSGIIPRHQERSSQNFAAAYQAEEQQGFVGWVEDMTSQLFTDVADPVQTNHRRTLY